MLLCGSLEEREQNLRRSDEDQSKGFRKDDGRYTIPRLLLCLMQQYIPSYAVSEYVAQLKYFDEN